MAAAPLGPLTLVGAPTLPPPACTAQPMVTPPTPLPYASVTSTVGGISTRLGA